MQMRTNPSAVSAKWSWPSSIRRWSSRELLRVAVTTCSNVSIKTRSPHLSHHSRFDLPRCVIIRSSEVRTVIALVLLFLKSSPNRLANQRARCISLL